MKKIISVLISIMFSVGLFIYLSGTPVIWKTVLSALMFISTYTLTDGFIKYE
jgi:hypothetical protein